MSRNDFTKQKNIDRSEYHLWVVYKPEYAAMHNANINGVKNYGCYTKNGKPDLDGLIERIVGNRSGQYKKIRLYNDKTNQVERAWDENGMETLPDIIVKINLNSLRKNTFNDKNNAPTK